MQFDVEHANKTSSSHLVTFRTPSFYLFFVVVQSILQMFYKDTTGTVGVGSARKSHYAMASLDDEAIANSNIRLINDEFEVVVVCC